MFLSEPANLESAAYDLGSCLGCHGTGMSYSRAPKRAVVDHKKILAESVAAATTYMDRSK